MNGDKGFMFTSRKVLFVAWALYILVVFLPGLLLESELLPRASTETAMIACAFFLGGLSFGALLFPFSDIPASEIPAGEIRRGVRALLLVGILLSIYIAVFGPGAPIAEAMRGTDSFALALLREDALKLNEDALFVRLYSLGRDVAAPVLFVLSAHLLRTRGDTSPIPLLGLTVAVWLGLWSGQKAPVVNYVIAFFLFSVSTVRQLTRGTLWIAPIVILLVFSIFAVSLPQVLGAEGVTSDAATIVARAIFNRILVGPLDVASAYVHARDDLGLISSSDAIPYFTFLWTPGIQSLENAIAMEFFYKGVDSGYANSLAFGYAYVLGGLPACAAGGVAFMLLLRTTTNIARSIPSPILRGSYDAMLCYLLLDALNSNFMYYGVKALALAVVLWLSAEVWMQLASPVGASRDLEASH